MNVSSLLMHFHIFYSFFEQISFYGFKWYPIITQEWIVQCFVLMLFLISSGRPVAHKLNVNLIPIFGMPLQTVYLGIVVLIGVVQCLVLSKWKQIFKTIFFHSGSQRFIAHKLTTFHISRQGDNFQRKLLQDTDAANLKSSLVQDFHSWRFLNSRTDLLTNWQSPQKWERSSWTENFSFFLLQIKNHLLKKLIFLLFNNIRG